MPKTMTTPSTTKQGFRWEEVSPLTSSVIAIVTVLLSAFAYVQGPINRLDQGCPGIQAPPFREVSRC